MKPTPGTRIKELRLLSELSQEELGRRVGVQRAAINKYEKGTVENIPIKTIEKIASVLNVTPQYIAGWSHFEFDSLSAEVKVLQGIKLFYGKEAVELLEAFTHLNKEGKKRLAMYADDLTKVYGDEGDLLN